MNWKVSNGTRPSTLCVRKQKLQSIRKKEKKNPHKLYLSPLNHQEQIQTHRADTFEQYKHHLN